VRICSSDRTNRWFAQRYNANNARIFNGTNGNLNNNNVNNSNRSQAVANLPEINKTIKKRSIRL